MDIPFSRPSLGPEEYEAIREVLDSGWLSLGPRAKAFEEELCRYTGAKHAVVMDSCTSALTISLQALRKMGYTKATTTPFTYVATANVLINNGYELEFADVDYNGNIVPNYVRPGNVIVPVHFAGYPCDISELSKVGRVIEDAAHALSSTYDGKLRVGNHPNSSGACFSFYATKPMTTGEGGAFVTNDDELFEGAKTLSLHGLGGGLLHRFERSSVSQPVITKEWGPGFKGYMNDIAAAMGIVQLRKLNGFTKRRREICQIYLDALWSKVDILQNEFDNSSCHMFVILVDNRDDFVKRMKSRGIGVGVHYSPPLHLHPFYRAYGNWREGDFPTAEMLSERCASLPLFPTMTDAEIEHVIKVVKEEL